MRHNISQLEVRSDSELLVRQMLGVYKVKNEGIRQLFEEAGRLLHRFDFCRLVHVRRELNRVADKLAKAGAAAVAV